ncbi:DUF5107 domain-containing protein [Microbacterium sp. RD1]|uniref:DUF5107 domain-containing protein n=1 Tax=Microbacterium sp. RD1 TaxID=3457313 RepID=UPI003FA5FD0C
MLRVESSHASVIDLPDAPASVASDPVAAWREPLVIDSYLPEQPDRFPSFFDARVYQGSSGRVYPLPFHERISPTPEPYSWDAVHLENAWLRIVILPQLGGRIHIAYDKAAGYDIFYRNNVIKPALVGLTGPWIAGGVEFNWPQHHRPATFLPTDVEIEREADGSVTVWCSDHDPFARMKGMHGIRLRPDSALIEARVRLYNRTDVPQTFLWWANVAAAVNDDYQSFFPEDVTLVADHARRAVTPFPHAHRYYGVDYPARRHNDHDDGDRLDWWRNIPVPTSYMVLSTGDDFFGGYDHGRHAGFVHWADRHIAPGKKQWTWGNSRFGEAWERNLTDGDGPYIELMAGVYTDNQPDFAWLAPGETKTFSQYWYPIQQIGPVQAATTRLAASVHGRRLGIAATERVRVRVRVRDAAEREVLAETVDIEPGAPLLRELDGVAPFEATLFDGDTEVLRVARREPAPQTRSAAVAPPRPEDVGGVEALYLIGRYLEQYRHATRMPDPYWQEALARDPGHTGSHIALGARAYEVADFETAVAHLTTAVERQTEWTPTPLDGEGLYRLGLALIAVGDDEGARERLGRAAWDVRWRDASSWALARLASRRGRWDEALRALDRITDRDHHQAACLRARILRHVGTEATVADVLERDPLDQWARDLAGLPMTADAPILLDVALEYAGAGFDDDALRVLDLAEASDADRPVGQVAVGPLVAFHRAFLLERQGRIPEAEAERVRAGALETTGCLPSRREDLAALSAAGNVPAALALRGHWLYDRRRRHEAIALWEQALTLTSDDELRVVLHRNLGVASYNVRADSESAAGHYRAALALAPDDAKLWYEYDELSARRGDHPAVRAARLLERPGVVSQRDDLTVTLAELLTELGRAPEALELLATRSFQPWEGGEGRVLGAWERVNARLAADSADPGAAESYLRAAIDPPAFLGEARHPLANPAPLHLALGDALDAQGATEAARQEWQKAASAVSDFAGMRDQAYSIRTVSAIVALRRLGDHARASELRAELVRHADELAQSRVEIDFFATSLPNMLLFVDDPQRAHDDEVKELQAALAAIATFDGDDAVDTGRLSSRPEHPRERQS